MNALQQVAQGDVLFSAVLQLPTDKQPRGTLRPAMTEDGRWIFARGEVTGHHHSSRVETCTLNLDEGGVMFLTVDQLTEVEHQEHGTVVLEPGVYRVDTQREVDAWGDWRPVAD